MKRELFLRKFTELVLNNNLSLFLGAGGSVDADYPTWSRLFKPLADSLDLPINDETDYYKLAQYYANNFGNKALHEYIHDVIKQNKHKSSLIDELLDIGFNNIWTTNFDNTLEMNYQERNLLINKVFSDENLANRNLDKRINVFKMNGDVDDLRAIIASQSDYEKYQYTHRLMLLFFKRALISSTFLFVGYSFRDHLVFDCLSEIKNYLGDAMPHHYAIMKDNSKTDPFFTFFIEDLEKRYNIQTVLVDEYADIINLLSELNSRVRNNHIFISGAFSVHDSGIEEFSHNFSKELTNALFYNEYRIVNGIGRRFGTHLIGYANKYLIENGKNIEKYLKITPFVSNDSNQNQIKKSAREQTIKQCGAALFVFGDIDNNSSGNISGVMEEYLIASSLHKIIIPILVPGMISEKIWEQINSNIIEYPYLERYMTILRYNVDTKIISDAVVQILDSVRNFK